MFEGFGSRGRTAFLNVVATRLTKQYVLGTEETNKYTDVAHGVGASQQTDVREGDLVAVVSSIGKWSLHYVWTGQSERNEFHSQQVVKLYTQQPNVFTPPADC